MGVVDVGTFKLAINQRRASAWSLVNATLFGLDSTVVSRPMDEVIECALDRI